MVFPSLTIGLAGNFILSSTAISLPSMAMDSLSSVNFGRLHARQSLPVAYWYRRFQIIKGELDLRVIR